MADGRKIAASTDALNALLSAAETRFRELAMGVNASVDMSNGVLVFRKEGSQWGLFVVRPNGASTPLLQASRAERIAAAQWLGKMHQQLHMNGATLAEELRVATEAARSFLYPVEAVELPSVPPVKT